MKEILNSLEKKIIYICGAGDIGHKFYELFKYKGYSCNGFFDSNNKEGNSDKLIFPISDLYKLKNATIIIGSIKYEQEISELLNNNVEISFDNEIILASTILIQFEKDLIHLKCQQNMVINYYGTEFSKNSLIVYITEPFHSSIINFKHQNQRQAVEIAKVLKKLEYNVDIVDFEDVNIVLNNKYDFILDIHPRKINCYDRNMKTDCIKVAYMTGSNPQYSNNAELERIKEASERRNYKFQPHRLTSEIDHKIEEYDGRKNETTVRHRTDYPLPRGRCILL